MSTAGSPTLTPAPVFEEPWQAQIFALVVRLHEQGLFSWPEWSGTLSEVLAQAQASAQDRSLLEQDPPPAQAPLSLFCPGAPDGAWAHWPVALERLLVLRGIAAPGALVALRQAWRLADELTPHGQPVVLRTGVRRFSGGGGHHDGAVSAGETAPVRTPAPGRAPDR
jgi:hypothetical protein